MPLKNFVDFGPPVVDAAWLNQVDQLLNASTRSVFNVRSYGAVGDGVADDTPAFLAARNAAQLDGGLVYAPAGEYKLTGDIEFTWPNAVGPDEPPRCGFIGDGAGLTFLYDYRTVPSAEGLLSLDMSAYSGSGVDARNLLSKFGGFSIIKKVNATTFTLAGDGNITYSLGTGNAIYLNNLPVLTGSFEEIRIIGYLVGVKSIGMLGGGFRRVNVQSCDIAFDIARNATAEPNSITFTECSVAACRTWGWKIVEGGSNSWVNGVIAGCGMQGTESGGIYYEASDVQTGGISVKGMYCELNRGAAEIFIKSPGGKTVYSASLIESCLFARNFANYWTTNNILLQCDGTYNGTLVTQANSFRGFGGYVESAARKYIAVTGTTGGVQVAHLGNAYASATAAPTAANIGNTLTSLSVGSGQGTITAVGDNVLLAGVCGAAPGVGFAPPTNNAFINGSPSFRWSNTATVNLDVSGTITWGTAVIAVPPGGTTNFLRADGTWAAPPGSTLASSPPPSVGATNTTGTSSNAARQDHTHALDTSIARTWTGIQTFNIGPSFAAGFNISNQQSINYGVTASAANAQIRCPSNNLYISSQGACVAIVDAGGSQFAFLPLTDNSVNLGGTGFKWKEVWSNIGTINTSDARLKTPLRPFTQAELRAASRIAREVSFWQWKTEVGFSKIQRCGLTVQLVMSILEAEGLDPLAYDFIRHDMGEVEGKPYDEYSFNESHLHFFIARGQEERLARLEAMVLG